MNGGFATHVGHWGKLCLWPEADIAGDNTGGRRAPEADDANSDPAIRIGRRSGNPASLSVLGFGCLPAVHYGTVSSDVSSTFGTGSISATGYGVGGTLTWFGNSGFYVDTQAQATGTTATSTRTLVLDWLLFCIGLGVVPCKLRRTARNSASFSRRICWPSAGERVPASALAVTGRVNSAARWNLLRNRVLNRV
ncbi:autotransporter outer membrane beta-barrel domain-containing protein [Mesorhizobium sp. CA8]|uniref:autotransporter outer membrane beta-barrel domain-containing protein n=1 Tax=Mesorhizobium sp. CA8 TaxID=2876637 RepID=UPI0029621D6A|nr:autotransporter outer membrane beta-barrel domain-containing protein [Mesorhizobium sp. CA8]